jgi:hypothetical protein
MNSTCSINLINTFASGRVYAAGKRTRVNPQIGIFLLGPTWQKEHIRSQEPLLQKALIPFLRVESSLLNLPKGLNS